VMENLMVYKHRFEEAAPAIAKSGPPRPAVARESANAAPTP